MFFDGAARIGQSREDIVGVGIGFILLKSDALPYAYSLTEPCSNNVAEYNALIIGLQIVEEMGVK